MSAELLRRKKRFSVTLPVRIRSPFHGQPENPRDSRHSRGPTERSVTHNVSSTGCYFQLSHGLPLGSVIDLEIEIPALQPIPRGLTLYCRARVVRVDDALEGAKMGIACRIEDYRLSRSRRARASAIAA